MFKVKEEEVKHVLEQYEDEIMEAIVDYNNENGITGDAPIHPESTVYPIADIGFIAMIYVDDVVIGSIVVWEDESIFTSYYNIPDHPNGFN